MTYDPSTDPPTTRDRVVVDRVDPAPVETVVERPVVERPVIAREREYVRDEPVVAATSGVDTARRLVWLLFGVLQALIVIRVILLVLGANEGNDLVSFILGVTDPFVEPFRGMFDLDSVRGASGSVLDIAALVALVAWTLIEALVLGIVGLADRRTTTVA